MIFMKYRDRDRQHQSCAVSSSPGGVCKSIGGIEAHTHRRERGGGGRGSSPANAGVDVGRDGDLEGWQSLQRQECVSLCSNSTALGSSNFPLATEGGALPRQEPGKHQDG